MGRTRTILRSSPLRNLSLQTPGTSAKSNFRGQIPWLVFEQEQKRKDQACPELVEGAGFFRLGEEAAETERTDEVTVLDISDYQPPRVPSRTWRELIKKACAREGGYLGSGPSELSSMRP
jgi:hypothetical protein